MLNYVATEGHVLTDIQRELLGYFLTYYEATWLIRIKPINFCVGGMPRRTICNLEALNKKVGTHLGTKKHCLKTLSMYFYYF